MTNFKKIHLLLPPGLQATGQTVMRFFSVRYSVKKNAESHVDCSESSFRHMYTRSSVLEVENRTVPGEEVTSQNNLPSVFYATSFKRNQAINEYRANNIFSYRERGEGFCVKFFFWRL